MLFIPFIVIYLGLNLFIAWDLYLWINAFGNPFKYKRARAVFAVVFSIFTLFIIAAFFLPETEIKRIFSRLTNYYLGFLINLLMVIVLSHVFAFFLKLFKITHNDYFKKGKQKVISGAICGALAVGFSVYGFINANYITTSSYDIRIDKKGEDMKIVLIADTHLGYTLGVRNMEEMAEKINKLEPDIVCFAGDIFDNDFDALDDPEGIKEAFLSIESKYGIYACWGNHDVNEKLMGGFAVSFGGVKKQDERMRTFLDQSGITLLEDEIIVINNKFTLIGRLDMSKPGTDDQKRLAIDEFEFDESLPVICIDHEPDELDNKADAGIDLDLGGHTHNGQFFPMNLFIGLRWDNPKGCKKIAGKNGHTMYSVVTEGVGVYGPYMRTFTNSEIVLINVDFAE